MNIILLSGGSGKRLWPLSNDVRSKQFIKLFKDDNDQYESMVQRVYRQIQLVNPETNVTIATSKSQASAIKNQLGDKVSICVEPCRRDTFPAILLASVYLKEKKKIPKDENVIVCPVDPYVDISYFEAFKKIEENVNKNESNLTLLGIEPTYPSEKYGYIIPNSPSSVSKVNEFKEKPDTKTAEKYINQNALWNAGIFAFKLGYLVDIAHELVDFKTYEELYDKYETIEKTSFDYGVVEKETNIEVIRYNGDWKDVGTWNMMTEVMADNIKGEAVMDDYCKNTQIINELDVPIIALGCEDMVIAASNDGILVSDKERSGYMKPFVENLRHGTMFAEKSWGTYKVIDMQSDSMTIKISMRCGESMSYHSHDNRDEVWTIISGEGMAIVEGIEYVLKKGNTLEIPRGMKHSLVANSPDLELIEVQLGNSISVVDKRKHKLEYNDV
ncbi:sugar phosphate nucleotidyltransferase [Enterococcus sp. AZ109]|uniref:sugar phosphate nucleotidyltransferase n=1 Tax=Enterococcus sp. AZ109 TaxID=2774634 RepID=UPI003F26A6AA